MQVNLSNYAYAKNMIKSVNGNLNQYTNNSQPQANKNNEKPNSDSLKLEVGAVGAGYDYSKQDAIQKQYDISMGRTSIFDDFKSGAIFAPKEFEDTITDVATDVSWNAIEHTMKGIKTDDINQSIDYLSSIYVAAKEHINTNFTGAKKAEELSKLDELVNTYKEKTINEFSTEVGGFLDQNGNTGQADKIAESLHKIFDEKVEKFTEIVNQNSDYANIEGTKDEWLKNDVSYMASELKKAGNADTNTDTTYSLEDLSATQSIVKEIKSYGFGLKGSSSYGTFSSEEYVGIKLSELSLKTKIFTENSSISQSVKDLIFTATNNFIENSIDELSDALDYGRNNPEVAGDVAGFTPLDESAIKDVINKVMNSYEKTGDTSKAIKDGINFAISNYSDKMDKDGSYRYTGNPFNDFFEYSYATKFDNLVGSNYVKGESDFDRIVSSFNSFVDKFGLGNENKLKNSIFSALI